MTAVWGAAAVPLSPRCAGLLAQSRLPPRSPPLRRSVPPSHPSPWGSGQEATARGLPQVCVGRDRNTFHVFGGLALCTVAVG